MSRKKRRTSSHDFDSEKPWTEAQWEAFMKESESRAARYGELLETFHDEPDGQEMVEREMGWLTDDDDEDDPELAAERAGWIQEMNEAGAEALRELEAERAADAAAGITPAQRREMEHEQEKRDHPAYGAAMDLGHRVIDLFEPQFDREAKEDSDRPRTRREQDEDELLGEAFISIQIAGAKLTGAIAMGEEDDSICGNIVRCRMALEAAETGRAAWERLMTWDGKPFANEVIEEVIAGHAHVIEMINARIAELRSRVWW